MAGEAGCDWLSRLSRRPAGSGAVPCSQSRAGGTLCSAGHVPPGSLSATLRPLRDLGVPRYWYFRDLAFFAPPKLAE